MRIEFERKTVGSAVVFCGVGIHSHTPCTATVEPSDGGLRFIRDGVATLASPGNVTDTTRSTSLGNVQTVEHAMSALAAHGITDADVIVDGEEMPILDGSAAEYISGLKAVGFQILGKRACRLFGRVNLNRGDQRIGVSVGTGRWRYEFERDGRWPGYQAFEAYLEGAAYEERIAGARTFAFEDEVESLRAVGLGKGGTKENTLIIGDHGYLTESRFSDEPARHKMLDCIGDIALSGVPPQFLNVVAERTGHRMNVRAAERLVEICTWEE